MTEEEKKEIEELKLLLLTDNITQHGKKHLIEIYENLIKKQQAEIEKKDKTIKNMSNYIYNVDYRSECGNTRKQVKQYFEKQVESEEKQ